MKIDPLLTKSLQLKIAAGGQDAFASLYNLFFLRLFKFVMQYVHRKEAAEEIVNDVMVGLWKNREGLHEIENIETYLFIACRNRSLSYLEKYSAFHIEVESASGLPQFVNNKDPEKLLEWKELYHRLNLAIASLPDQSQTVFRLIKEEGFRYKEVAEILGISSRTVETLLFRTMRKLVAIIKDYRKEVNGSSLLMVFYFLKNILCLYVIFLLPVSI